MPNLALPIHFLALALTASVVWAGVPNTQLRRVDTPLTFDVRPSPTVTGTAIASAYSVYSQRCGPNEDAYAYSVLPGYISGGGQPTARITDDAFVQWMEQDTGWSLVALNCTNAENVLDNLVFEATSTPDPTPPPTPPPTPAPAPTAGDTSSFSFSDSIPSFSGSPTTGTGAAAPNPTQGKNVAAALQPFWQAAVATAVGLGFGMVA
ncbi:hypothetical protein C8R46DRAFT_1229632 [Mycena filopes]|nr:hypothetical protein C8R46DRAFT_1229632 [Mycena filopes]